MMKADSRDHSSDPCPHPGQVLKWLRIGWTASLSVQIGLLVAVVAAWRSGFAVRGYDSLVRQLHGISWAVLVLAVVAGWWYRMQVYKAGWQGDRITPGCYFKANLVLLGLLEAAGLLALLVTLLHGAMWPTVLPAGVALVLEALNYPHGKPMRPQVSIYEKKTF